MLRSIIVLVLTILITSASDIRRVVTGLDESNRSTVMFDSQVDVKDIRPDLSPGYLWVSHAFPIDVSTADTKEDVRAYLHVAYWTQSQHCVAT
jgi:hypothetical protein